MVASLVFYARWNPPYVLLVIASILFNYGTGSLQHGIIQRRGKASKAVLAFGVATNLALLGYFKYANFFVDTVARATGSSWHIEPIVLPLAISFFTFTQIAYLVDVWEGMVCSYSFLDYCFFVLFFPHLIAGPIVRHHEILPQVQESDGRLKFDNLYVNAGHGQRTEPLAGFGTDPTVSSEEPQRRPRLSEHLLRADRLSSVFRRSWVTGMSFVRRSPDVGFPGSTVGSATLR